VACNGHKRTQLGCAVRIRPTHFVQWVLGFALWLISGCVCPAWRECHLGSPFITLLQPSTVNSQPLTLPLVRTRVYPFCPSNSSNHPTVTDPEQVHWLGVPVGHGLHLPPGCAGVLLAAGFPPPCSAAARLAQGLDGCKETTGPPVPGNQ